MQYDSCYDLFFFLTYVIMHTDAVRADDAVYYAIACDSWGDVSAAHITPDAVPKFMKSTSHSVSCNCLIRLLKCIPALH